MDKYTATNCIIAEFMTEECCHNRKSKILEYHTDWNCLMPVVSKIEKLRKDADPKDVDFVLLKEDINDALSIGDLRYAYHNILNFIYWFNVKNNK